MHQGEVEFLQRNQAHEVALVASARCILGWHGDEVLVGRLALHLVQDAAFCHYEESISFAFMTVGVKKAGKDNVLGLTCLANLFTAFFVFTFLPPKVTDVLAFSGQDWLIIFLLGVVNVAFGYAFYNTGVARTTPQKAAVIALWEMILAPTWTAIFLHEYPSLMVIVGFVIIIAGIFVDAKVDSPAKA